MRTKIIAACLLVSGMMAMPIGADNAVASAFWGGTVIQAPASNPLNIRAWPSTGSAVQRTYTTGMNISMTGRCKNTVTNKSFRIDVAGSVASKYNKMKKPNVWCEIYHEVPAGSSNSKAGWGRGKFITPQ
jgi:hypothetical protein